MATFTGLIHPLRCNVLVEMLPRKESESGIVVPDMRPGYREAGEARYKVLAVGPEAKDVKVGDVVFITPYTGSQVTMDGTVRVCKEEDILLVEGDS